MAIRVRHCMPDHRLEAAWHSLDLHSHHMHSENKCPEATPHVQNKSWVHRDFVSKIVQCKGAEPQRPHAMTGMLNPPIPHPNLLSPKS